MIRTTVQQGAKTAASKATQQPTTVVSRTVSTIPQRLIQDDLGSDLQSKPHDAARMLHMRRGQRVQGSSTIMNNNSPERMEQSWPQSALDQKMQVLSVENPNYYQSLAFKAEDVMDELRQLREALLPPVKPQCKESVKGVLGKDHYSSASFLDKVRMEIDELFDCFAPILPPQCKDEQRKVLGDGHLSDSIMEQFKVELEELKEILSPPAKVTEADKERLKTVGRDLRGMLEYEKSHIRRVLLTPDQWKKDAEMGTVAFKPVVRKPTVPATAVPAEEVLNNESTAEKLVKELGELTHSVSSKARHEAMEQVNEVKFQAKEKAVSAWC